MAPWTPGTQYNLGDVVDYDGQQYQIIQPHRAQSDWAPAITPALWGRTSGHGNQQQYQQPQQPQQNHQPQQQQPYQQQQQQPPAQQQVPQGGYNNPVGQKVDIPKEEEKKKWYDLDDDRKEKLMVGGGLVAGLGLLGAGYHAYKKHEENEEEEKAQAWALQSWLREAERRTEEFRRNGPRGPVTWILNTGKRIPQDAIVGGEHNGNIQYIARAYQDNGVQVGKAGAHLKHGATIGYKNDEIDLGTYEILLGDMRALRWVDYRGNFDLGKLNGRPVEGGYENNGAKIYIGQAEHRGGTHVAKVAEGYGGAFITYDGDERKQESYRVLCYA